MRRTRRPGGHEVKVGISVECEHCRRYKAPRGRSVPMEMGPSLCRDDCRGYYLDPKPGSLWPGETSAEFGYPISDDATREVDDAALEEK